MLNVNNISAGYQGVDVIKNITFNLAPGENLAILGPNGCGKSTLLKAISGILKSNGNILINDKNTADMNRLELSTHMAVMSQISSIYFSYTVYETILLGRYVHMKGGSLRGPSQKDKDFASECMNRVGLSEVSNQQINTLSGGQLQRVYLARTLAQEPDIILLDEPTNHLDLKHQIGLIDFLKEWSKSNQRCVVGVLHDINLALRLADKLLFLNDGKVIAYGPTKEIISKELLTQVYDMDVVNYMVESLKNWEPIKK